VNSKALSLWFADGTNFPGQGDFRARYQRFDEGLKEIHSHLKPDETMLIEYKPFEPAFYATDIPDWGTAYLLSQSSGSQAKVLVDLGHHLHGCNIEQIVAILQLHNRLGGFHFNARKYADDDLTTGSINPYELFLIFVEIVKSGEPYPAFMIDEMHSLKNKIGEMIQSLVTIQNLFAKALTVDLIALKKYQTECDLIKAEEVLKDAYLTDVRSILEEFRASKNCPNPSDPVSGFLSL
jgi:L-rhamnose isomerase / sugar isomerase